MYYYVYSGNTFLEKLLDAEHDLGELTAAN